jgi:hypothetical protein
MPQQLKRTGCRRSAWLQLRLCVRLHSAVLPLQMLMQRARSAYGLPRRLLSPLCAVMMR